MILKVTLVCDTCGRKWTDVAGVFHYFRDAARSAIEDGWYVEEDGYPAECEQCKRMREVEQQRTAMRVVEVMT